MAGNIAEGATVAGGTCIYEEHFGSGQTRGGATAGRNEFLLLPDTEYDNIWKTTDQREWIYKRSENYMKFKLQGIRP